jgi:hypothetical protein
MPEPTTPHHPCRFSPEVLAMMAPYLPTSGHRVHDPFAGTGARLSELCDELGLAFTGGDIEDWPRHDPRVVVADALDPATYPPRPFTIVTSPVYVNKRCGDYANGPTSTTVIKGRRDYGISLGRPLDARNLARVTGRPSKAEAYWQLHGEIVGNWDSRLLLNVDLPISERWQQTLRERGYRIEVVLPAYTRRYGGLANAEKRTEHEVVIVAGR